VGVRGYVGELAYIGAINGITATGVRTMAVDNPDPIITN